MRPDGAGSTCSPTCAGLPSRRTAASRWNWWAPSSTHLWGRRPSIDFEGHPAPRARVSRREGFEPSRRYFVRPTSTLPPSGSADPETFACRGRQRVEVEFLTGEQLRLDPIGVGVPCAVGEDHLYRLDVVVPPGQRRFEVRGPD